MGSTIPEIHIYAIKIPINGLWFLEALVKWTQTQTVQAIDNAVDYFPTWRKSLLQKTLHTNVIELEKSSWYPTGSFITVS